MNQETKSKKISKLWPAGSVNWSREQEKMIKIPLMEGIRYFVIEWKKILGGKP